MIWLNNDHTVKTLQDLVGHLGAFVYLRFLILSVWCYVHLYKLFQMYKYANFQALSDKVLLKLNTNVQKRPVSPSRSLMGWIGNDYMHCIRTPHFKNQIQNILMVLKPINYTNACTLNQIHISNTQQICSICMSIN